MLFIETSPTKRVIRWLEGNINHFGTENKLLIEIQTASITRKEINKEIKELSADPYDDQLMENFCSYIILSQKKIEKVEKIYNKKIVPKSISALGLDLYHCFSQVKDALSEFDRYTQGYVDNYLFDGKEMIKEAKRIQSKMSIEKKNKNF